MNPDKTKIDPRLQRMKDIAAVVMQDTPSTKEVVGLLANLIKSVKDALKQTQDSVMKDCIAIMEKCMVDMASGDKKVASEAYKALSNEVYKLELKIKEIPQFDSSILEKKWSLVITDLQSKIDAIKPFVLTGEDIVNKINELPLEDDFKIEKEHIKGIDEIEKNIKSIELRPTGGGGSRGFQLYTDTVKRGMVNMVNFVAGSGITLTYTASNGRNDITVSAVAGGASEVPSGDINGTNTTFTFLNAPKVVIIDQGRTMILNHGFTADATGKIIVVDVAPNDSIFSI